MTTSPLGAADGAPLLEVRDLVVEFPTGGGTVHAVRGVSWSVAPGETLAVVGESGSGKSVSSLAVMGLLPRTARVSGSVLLRGRELLGLSEKELSAVRGAKVAMIFQDPMTSLNPVYTVGWQISEALRAHHPDMSKKAAMERSIELLALVDVPNPTSRVEQFPHEFSGGMRQRAVIAMAMANDPDVIIADEPTTALDVTVQAQVLETLQKAQDETGAGMVLITHDLGVVAGVADRVVVMYAGRAVEVGDVETVFASPRMPYTLGLLGSLPRLDARESERLTPIKGAPPSMVNMLPGCPFGPRCTMHRGACDEAEPELLVTDGLAHSSACWFSAELAPVTPPPTPRTRRTVAAVTATRTTVVRAKATTATKATKATKATAPKKAAPAKTTKPRKDGSA
jgi:oligopeptide/dipeptide ABC transporter ATP-binding protein